MSCTQKCFGVRYLMHRFFHSFAFIRNFFYNANAYRYGIFFNPSGQIQKTHFS
jgi:hypothetical protein